MNLTDEQKQHVLEIVKAYIDGKQIERLSWVADTSGTTPTKCTTAAEAASVWKPYDVMPSLVVNVFSEPDRYRIKPEPTYKPYTSVCPEWIGKVLKSTDGRGTYSMVIGISLEGNKIYLAERGWVDLKFLHNNLWYNVETGLTEPFGELSE